MTEEDNKKKPFTLFNNETGQSVELPVLTGTSGPDVLDIRNLYKDTGLFTYDPGYGATGSCESEITYINGEEGVLLHRGYPIEELAKNLENVKV